VLLLAACEGGAGAPRDASSDWPATNGPLPSESSAVAKQATLGRLLFYDPILSGDGQTACATCHSELWGMSDGLPRSVGQGAGLLAGPGRRGPNVLTRNAPTLWNVAFRTELMWDGREPSLEAQVLMPLHADSELGLDPDEAARRIASSPDYVARFAAAFPKAPDVSVAHVQAAIAAFERTLIADDSLWDAWRDGDARALSDAQVRGYDVFVASGCDGCHVPPLFESDVFAVRRAGDDLGRMLVTEDVHDRGAFRTPTLRNMRESGPYFHDGAVVELHDAIVSELDVDGVTLAPADLDALVSFVGRALVDVSRAPDRPDTVPSGLPLPEDGFRIVRP